MPLPILASVAAAAAPKLIELVGGWIDRAVPDENLAAKLKHDMRLNLLPLMQQELQVQGEIIVAEAKSESWLARSWRPITMLTFVGLVVARWFGLTIEGIDDQLELALMELIKIGLGGYVVGRSAEKVASAWNKK
jgi:hypothetical protein